MKTEYEYQRIKGNKMPTLKWANKLGFKGWEVFSIYYGTIHPIVIHLRKKKKK